MKKKSPPEDGPADAVDRDTPTDEEEAVVETAFEEIESLGSRQSSSDSDRRNDLTQGIHLKVRAELGRRRLPLKEALKLEPGAVVDLEKLADDPIDLYVNDLLVARGEVVLVNDCFCVRITEVLPAVREVAS